MRIAWGIALLATCFACPGIGQQVDIKNLVTSGQMESMRWPNFVDYRSWLQKFYEPAGFAPAWMVGSQPAPVALSLIELFRNAGVKGLNPEDYDSSRWNDRIQTLNGASPGSAVARFDVAMTVCTMRYVSDLRIGRINPQHFNYGLSVEGKKYDLAQFVRSPVIPSSNLKETLDGIEPPFAGYRRSEQALARYVEIARMDTVKNFPPLQSRLNQDSLTRGSLGLPAFFGLWATCRRMQSNHGMRVFTAVPWWMRSNATSAAMASKRTAG
jgi:murein L,D-transpeptidase YcbB/YkuD